MLLEGFLKPLGLTLGDAARELGMSVNRLNELVLGKRGATADTALRLARRSRTTPQVWMHLQADWDLHMAVRKGSAAQPTPPPPCGGSRWPWNGTQGKLPPLGLACK
jgi:addiction module HigA family antidote